MKLVVKIIPTNDGYKIGFQNIGYPELCNKMADHILEVLTKYQDKVMKNGIGKDSGT